MPKNKEEQHTRLIKVVIIIGLLSGMFAFTGIVLSSYPQHLYLGSDTVVDGMVGYANNSSINVRGNMVQFSPGDVIPLKGRDYIKITGSQVQIGGSTFTSAIRSISAQLHQSALFEQKIGTLYINSAGKVIIDNTTITLIPVTRKILNIKTEDSDYNVEFVNNIVYIKTGNVMLKLFQDNDNIDIYLVGTSHYNNIIFLKI